MFDLKGYEASLLEGAWVTLEVALASLLLALLLGMLGALAKLSPYKWARAIATGYTTIIRGIPDLVLMMLLFFGGQVLINGICSWVNETNPFVLLLRPFVTRRRLTFVNFRHILRPDACVLLAVNRIADFNLKTI